jgi:hypothetical protein
MCHWDYDGIWIDNFELVLIESLFIIEWAFFEGSFNVDVFEPLSVKARTIKSTKLRWKIPPATFLGVEEFSR